jgi:hypothetical protein
MGSLTGMMATAGRGLTSREQLASLDARIGVGQFAESSGHESPFEGSALLMGRGPRFPVSAGDRLREMLFAHLAARENFTNELSAKLLDMKEQFFESFHYESTPDQEGKEQVVLDQSGRPQLAHGRENPMQRAARQDYETVLQQAYGDKHAGEKEKFIKEERQQLTNFLQMHKYDLGNPAVQAELQRMILLTQKKALKLQQSQEEESWKLTLPTEEMYTFVDDEAKKLRDMEEKQREVEDGSQEARELIMYQEELNMMLKEERQKAQSQEKDEVFLKGPGAFLKPPTAPALSTVLPPYLTEALYNMGIYSLD